MGKRPERYWRTGDAKKVLSEWKASGLSISAFSRKTGLRKRRLDWWRRRLGEWSEEEVSVESAIRLVPLVPTEIMASPARMRGAVTMRLPGGIELEFEDAQLSPEWVAALAHEIARAR